MSALGRPLPIADVSYAAVQLEGLLPGGETRARLALADPKQTLIPDESGRSEGTYGATFKPSAANKTGPL